MRVREADLPNFRHGSNFAPYVAPETRNSRPHPFAGISPIAAISGR
jgi:hypothetical protein